MNPFGQPLLLRWGFLSSAVAIAYWLLPMPTWSAWVITANATYFWLRLAATRAANARCKGSSTKAL